MILKENKSLNQIKREYNNILGDIPGKKLKELYDQLYYKAYYTLFIDRDFKVHSETLDLINTLTRSNDSWKVFNASKDALVSVPLNIAMELHNTMHDKIKDLTSFMGSSILYGPYRRFKTKYCNN
ncbi:MAG: hypothetical protein PHY59_00700 [Methanobacterium sp.]|nr:hypothetical protein [Methanobacterium sp.]